LYSGQSQNFGTVVDPCSLRNLGTGSPTRAANCRAAGIPATYDFVYTASLRFNSGSNPNLKPETSESRTIGAVLQPRFIPGFSLSVDFFDIRIKDLITTPSAQQILNSCYDAPAYPNQFCTLFNRAGATAASTGELPYQIIEGSLQSVLFNYAKRVSRGYDVEANYRRALGSLGTISNKLIYTHTIERNDFLDPTQPAFANQILWEAGDPVDAANLDVTFTRGKLNVAWELRYLSKMTIGVAEDLFSVQGRAPENADWGEKNFYPETFFQDLRVSYDFSKTINAYVGIDNLTNRLPPLGATAAAAGNGIFEPRGRFYYVGLKADLGGIMKQ
jgi:outer membrane receptor protein involved in Fe transport